MRWPSLIAIALLAAVGWRLEVEWHGWGGLGWIGYFHWAIPAGALLFSGWLYRFGGARRPMVLALAAFGLAAAVFLIEINALSVVYSRWPGSQTRFLTAVGLNIGAFVAYPIGLWWIARGLGAPIRLRRCLLALAVYGAAFPATVALLDVLSHRGGADMLHAIKTGFVIPWLIVSLGLPFAGEEAGAAAP